MQAINIRAVVMPKWSRLCSLILLAVAGSSQAAQPYCLDEICLGATIDQLQVKWKDLPPTTQETLDFESMLQDKKIKDVYFESNELMIASEATLRQLFPYVIRRQVFDNHVLSKLREVKAYCSSTTLTGEVLHEGKDKLFVTVRAVPDNGGVGKLRVVGIEKQFDIMASSLRPQDKPRDKAMRAEMKARYPDLVEVRDLDSTRVSSVDISMAGAQMGYRFHSEVSIPLTLRLRDTADITTLEESDQASPLCKKSAEPK
ncbi:hypothetical protein HPT27_15870 [Permianibacter sp. IMCC34836]|uniref:hypothetical protein n=1 Tax=Permianibacter fluminis TaxID=2738515 RepID=UPI001557DA71|nr:hypothetical protein [Permianibacter fluminis]NQD38500.1 hypothetical protein [Permianibacter fluminis]